MAETWRARKDGRDGKDMASAEGWKEWQAMSVTSAVSSACPQLRAARFIHSPLHARARDTDTCR